MRLRRPGSCSLSKNRQLGVLDITAIGNPSARRRPQTKHAGCRGIGDGRGRSCFGGCSIQLLLRHKAKRLPRAERLAVDTNRWIHSVEILAADAKVSEYLVACCSSAVVVPLDAI